MKLPKLKFRPVPQWQKERLARWLTEWEIDRSLADSRDETAKGQSHACTTSELPGAAVRHPGRKDIEDMAASVSGEPAVETGQIRLMSPENPGADVRPVYLAVLHESGPVSFLAAPYSRFAEPANEGELLTGRTVPCLQVLCLWNARRIPAEILKKSWVIDRLSDDEMNKALAVLHHATGKAALPMDIAKLVGPPIQHPDDPRRTYREEETELMEAILEHRDRTVIPLQYDIEGKKALPLAAEPPASYVADSSLQSIEYTASVGAKFYPDGKVRTFPGNTIICFLDPKTELFREIVRVQEQLKTLRCHNKLGFLPHDSFHMTVMELLCDQVREEKMWSRFLSLSTSLAETNDFLKSCVPQVPAPPGFRMNYGNISLEDVATIYLTPADPDTRRELKSYRDRISEATGIRFPDHDRYRFHITIAYKLIEFNAEEQEEVSAVLGVIDRSLQTTFGTFNSGPPKLVFFDDMFRFSARR